MAKATAKKAAAKKGAAKKAAPKTAAKKGAAKKAVAKKASPKKAVAKKTAAKTASKKVAAKKGAMKKTAPKKAAAKRMPAMTNETMLKNLFLDSLQDIYYAERSGLKALPKMAKAASTEEVRNAFEEHARVSEGQVQRLEQLFGMIGEKVKGKKCEAMEGLVREADSMIKETKKGSNTRDVALIMAAQKVEHYEIASYGSMATLAMQMGLREAKDLLGQILQEEKDSDQMLTQIAESYVNEQAEQEGSESEAGGAGNEEGEDEELDASEGNEDTEEDDEDEKE